MFSWSEKSINWFADSAAKTDFHKNIANEIIPYLSPVSTMLSLGSGLGFLERELSPYLKSITLVDNDENAVDFLNKNKKSNQVIINSNWSEITTKTDYLLLSFFSRMFIEDSLDDYLKITREKIFYIVNERRSDINQVIKYLDSKNVIYSYKKMKLEFNQILNKCEIEEYLFQYYSNYSSTKKQNLLKQFEEIDNEKVIFKNRKKIVLFIINTRR